MTSAKLTFHADIDTGTQKRLVRFLQEPTLSENSNEALLAEALTEFDEVHTQPYSGGINARHPVVGDLYKLKLLTAGKEILTHGIYILEITHAEIKLHRLNLLTPSHR